MSEKKKFKDSKLFGAIKEFAPDIIDKATDVMATVYPPLGVINTIVDSGIERLKKKDGGEDAINHLKAARAEYQEDYLEYYKQDVEDRKSARTRETMMAQLGQTDWMMYFSGIVGLGAFGVIVYAILFFDVPENPLLHQLVGMVEGVAVSIFAYYFGSSKGSKDKDK